MAFALARAARCNIGCQSVQRAHPARNTAVARSHSSPSCVLSFRHSEGQDDVHVRAKAVESRSLNTIFGGSDQQRRSPRAKQQPAHVRAGNSATAISAATAATAGSDAHNEDSIA